ncbi:MAG: helix-turn-helix transcriptional regulator [Bacteroidetes bacterium]|nr:helix-turn-helix transcriptional regulator [Bacteroidota bacterium]
MKLNKKEVAQNLRLFGYKRYGTMKKFAEALDMNPSTLYSGYLNGRSLPGPVLLVKLIDLGCNINWLLTSRETPFANESLETAHLINADAQPHRPLMLHAASPATAFNGSKPNGIRYAEGRR